MKCSFSRGQLERMRDMYVESYRRNREIAFPLCETSAGVDLGRKCVGEACAVSIKGCQRGQKKVGFVHTHPHTAPWINQGDLMAGISGGERLACVVGNTKAPNISVGGHESERAPPENLAVRCVDLHEVKGSGWFDQVRKEIKASVPQMKEERKAQTEQWNRPGLKVRVHLDNTPTWYKLRDKYGFYPKAEDHCSVALK